jgi:hypothetical protein
MFFFNGFLYWIIISEEAVFYMACPGFSGGDKKKEMKGENWHVAYEKKRSKFE